MKVQVTYTIDTDTGEIVNHVVGDFRGLNAVVHNWDGHWITERCEHKASETIGGPNRVEFNYPEPTDQLVNIGRHALAELEATPGEAGYAHE